MIEIERFEKRKSHQMVPVAVGDEKMVGVALVNHQLVAEAANAGTGIDDEGIATFGDDFKASRVTAVAQVLRPADRDGTP